MHVYETITQQIIAQLEAGTIPWRRPWRTRGVPRNLFSLKPYRGINVWLLLSRPYASPYWLTFRQANETGGTVRKGEKGTTIVLWKFPDDRTTRILTPHETAPTPRRSCVPTPPSSTPNNVFCPNR